MRLEKFRDELQDFPVYVVPVRHEFMFNEANKFADIVTGFVKTFKKYDS